MKRVTKRLAASVGARLVTAVAVVLTAALLAAGAEGPTPLRPEHPPQWLGGYGVRYQLRVVGDAKQQSAQSVLAVVPTGGWSLAEGTDIAVQRADGETIPARVRSHDADGDTIIQFPRQGDRQWYWVSLRSKKTIDHTSEGKVSEAMREGVVAEFRNWQGRQLKDWASVREGLVQSEQVLGNAIVGSVLQRQNLARPGQPRGFAASYRGYLRTGQSGTFRFLINGHDATFFFLGDELIHQRPGQNRPLGGRVPLDSVGKKAKLKKGVHRFEVHQAIGDNMASHGFLGLLWRKPKQNRWRAVPRGQFVRPMVARVTGMDTPRGRPGATFVWGIRDVFVMGRQRVYLVQFAANGALPRQARKLQWDFGNGHRGSGRRVSQLYFEGGDYEVTLKSGGKLPAYRRTIHLWPRRMKTSPIALHDAVAMIDAADFDQYELIELRQMMQLLERSGQANRWAPLAKLTAHLLKQDLRDPRFKANIYKARMRALAHRGEGEAAMALRDEALKQFEGIDVVRVEVLLTAADLLQAPLRRFEDASEAYQRILEEFGRLGHPAVREAAVHYGDLLVEAGNLTEARAAYERAASLGDQQTSAQAQAVNQGSLLRVAEQKLKSDGVREATTLLKKIERRSPAKKVSGLFRFLRGEALRRDGRYRAALSDYKLVLRLGQWRSFHNQSMLGLAKCQQRLGDLSRAMHWLDALKEADPAFYKKNELAEQRRRIEQQRDFEAKIKRKKAEGAHPERFDTGFEPGQPSVEPFRGNIVMVPSTGMDGPHVAALEAMPKRIDTDYERVIPFMRPRGYYWVTFWYRTLYGPERHMVEPYTIVALKSPDGERAQGSRDKVNFRRTFGRWRRAGALLRAPANFEGRLELHVRRVTGLLEMDGFSLRPVTSTARQALRDFEQGEARP